MKIYFPIPLVLVSLLLLASCQKEENQNGGPQLAVTSTQDLKVPAQFNFETERKLNYQFQLGEAPSPGNYRLALYDFLPEGGGRLLSTAFIDAGDGSLNGELALPASASRLYAVLTAPQGNSFTTTLALDGSGVLKHQFYQAKRAKKAIFFNPDCNSGCDQSLTFNGQWFNADQNKVYCLDVATIMTGTRGARGGININNGATVRLCGTGTIPNISVNNGSLILTANADITVANLNLNSGSNNSLMVIQGGQLETTNWFTPNADVTNYGSMSFASFNLNNDADFYNYGLVEITGTGGTSINGDFVNGDRFIINRGLTINGGADLENNCNLSIGGQLQVNGELENSAYVSVAELTTINGGGVIENENGAVLDLHSLFINGSIEGDGSTSLVKVATSSRGNNGARIEGDIEYCDADGIENFPNNIFRDGAKAACDVFIPTSTCILVGNGNSQVADDDGDGVANELDAYPNDPARAANSYYPAEGRFASLAFEDLWPNFGDYDFNDLVIDYRYQMVLNAANEMVDLNGRFITRALGGSFQNGFGIQLALPSAQVASVTGTRDFNGLLSFNPNGTESGQNNATIILYDDATQALVNTTGEAFVNTVSTSAFITPDTADLSISFSSPQSLAAVGSAPFNPFIFIDQDRGREVHLPGGSPTNLADQNLLGTGDDNSTSGENTYRSANNLPWALNIMGRFDYPEEKTDIVRAYLLFANWAESGGSLNTDWYIDQAGYRNEALLYNEAR